MTPDGPAGASPQYYVAAAARRAGAGVAVIDGRRPVEQCTFTADPCAGSPIVRVGFARFDQPVDVITWQPACAEHIALCGAEAFLRAYFGSFGGRDAPMILIRPLEVTP